MTQKSPMQDAYEQILRSYNPLEIKDILLHGASRKATQHKDADDIITYYANHNEGIHHNLLDAKSKYCEDYLMMQLAYNKSDKDQECQYYFLRDVVWLYIDAVADELGDEYKLHDKPRKEIEDEVLAIDLDIRKSQLQVIDGGKS
jgi:tRNA isopentenyl-2-thiomethyl-A-37 hydroxylase MiaE